ncbi:MOP flippase family protein [Alphaproteobacteria bacterium LSUCC0684]
MTLRRRTLSAVRWTTIGAVAKALLQVAQIAILARLLAPEDYGLMAMVTVVLSLAALFSDFGVNSAFLQRRDVSEEQRSSLFWFNVLLSFGLMVLVILLSPLFALYFGDERVGPLMMLSATTFVIAALGIQVRLAAEKELHFGPVVVIEVVAALLGLAVAITGALLEWGVYALVVGSIAAAIVTSLLLWGFLAQGWRPAMRLRFVEVRSFLGFGGALVANNVVNQINLTIDLLLGGRLLAAAQLGLYSIPRQLVLQVQFVVNPIITRVAFPLIAEVQHDIPRVRSIYLQILNMTASTNAPIYVGAFFFAPEIVHLVLGEGWEQSAVLLQTLALWGGLRSTGNPVGSLLLGMGRADLSLKWNLMMLLIVPPVVLFGSTFGPQGLAWSLFGLSVALFIPGWFVLIHPLCKATLLETAVASLRPFLIAGIAVGVSFVLAADFDGWLLRLVIAVMVSAPLYLGLSYLMNRSWVDLMWELITQRS